VRVLSDLMIVKFEIHNYILADQI
ncbi:MAG: hypothetical protein RIR48_1411, partial [Bacteroidota bacterium]